MSKKVPKMKSFLSVLTLLLFMAFLAGCADDGTNGAAGTDGLSAYELAVQDGFAGTEADWLASLQAQVPATEESCAVCHASGRIADLSVAHEAKLEKPVVSNIVVARDGADRLTVTFDVFEADGVTAFTGLGSASGSTGSDVRVYMADIVPAGTVTGNAPQTTWDTAYLEMWTEERGDDAGVVFTEPVAGSYSFVMDAGAFAEIGGATAPEADVTHKQRVYVRADARDFTGFDRSMGVADFDMPAQTANTGAISTTTRTIVDASACTACHNDPLEGAAHGGGYQSPQVCNMCHSPIGMWDEDDVTAGIQARGDYMQQSGWWLASLIHQIHSAKLLPGVWPGRAQLDTSELTYPKNIKDCEACHFDAGQDLADAWKTNPTIEVCTTCHDVTFSGVAPTHSGGAMPDNTGCSLCHPATGVGVGKSITTAHAVTTLKLPDGNGDPVSITPNYTSIITLSAPAVGAFYTAGEQILVTVTVEDGNGDPVSTYDDAASTFTAANLYVYGPRAQAMPVLATGSTTDVTSNWTEVEGDGIGNDDGICSAAEATAGGCLPVQSHSMLITSTDPQVMTDVDGFKYQLLAIPADMEAGTYMVQAAISDPTSRHTGSRNYNIDGWAVETFQVGTATVEDRVAGDGCADCHDQADWGTMYHRSYFGTDGCLACHDQSGNHADPIANRVHAVHAAAATGDLLGLAWDGSDPDIEAPTFPQSATTCDGCHNSGNDSYRTDPGGLWGVACIGCHADITAGARDHMIQNGAEVQGE